MLAEEEPLTLTEIALRLQPHARLDEGLSVVARGRGSRSTSRQKRYSFADPMLRLWVRLHCRAVPPTEDDIAREVQHYVLARLPHAEPALALAGAQPRRTARRAGASSRLIDGLVQSVRRCEAVRELRDRLRR